MHERVAVIDLGSGLAPQPGAGPWATSGSEGVQSMLQAAIVAAGLDPVIGDGVEDALAGRDVDRDTVQLAAAIAAAQRAFGNLTCSDVIPAAQQAIGLSAARQAAGYAVPELSRAWTYLLLCADRENQLDAALTAAGQLRALGGSPDVPASVWARYPEVDVVANREFVELDIDTDVPGAAIWIDFQKVGVSPVHVTLPAGDHVLAAAAGTKRGWAAGTAVRTQRSVHVPLTDVTGPWSEVAQRVAGWHGKRPPPAELAWLLARVHARVALVRHGDTIEAWGQIGRSEAPHQVGGDDGVAPIGEVARVLGLIADRIHTWNDHAPDPDQPLLVETREPRGARKDGADKPTRWWVYAAIAGAVAIGATIIYAHDSASDRQRVELHYP
ncbi:MAG TPA: PEGA domain-containing protein [Kofleriaceae bacterium]|nr:PEGA domain-containing protein [Kofleriaceae bacterium]